jgi:hypothetical protein
LHCEDFQPCADFVAKVLAGLSDSWSSDRAPNVIPHSAVVRNAILRIALIGTKILSVNDALNVTQATDRLLQQNLPKASVIATQQFSRSADYSMISSASVRRVAATKGLDV